MSKNIVETARHAGSFSTAARPDGTVDDRSVSSDGGIHVGDASVVTADIEASNGIIHVIDRVLLPAAA
jgi:uncharacterized surface protein with fasciclin (FAS1) repeats